jgi:hypothetical protein
MQLPSLRLPSTHLPDLDTLRKRARAAASFGNGNPAGLYNKYGLSTISGRQSMLGDTCGPLVFQ